MTLQKNNLIFPILIAAVALLFVGAGCSNNEQNPANDTNTEVAQKTVVKKPDGVDTIDHAITACENQGFLLTLKYNKETKSTDTYCQFGDGYACNALSYFIGSCTTTSTNRIYLAATVDATDNLRTCSEDEVPVCGKDGVTYVNTCIATLQNAVISHTGVCTEDEITVAVGSNPSGNTSGDSSNSGNSESTDTSAPPTGTPLWTTHLLSIVGNRQNGPGAPVTKECTFGSTRVFYLVENCPNCFSTLYNNSGKVLCHPHNDIANECPSYFNKDNHNAHCKNA